MVYFTRVSAESLVIDVSHFVKSILIFYRTPVIWWLTADGDGDGDGLQQIFSLPLDPRITVNIQSR